MSAENAAVAGVWYPVCCLTLNIVYCKGESEDKKKGISPSFWERNSSSNAFCTSMLLVRLVCSACFLIAHFLAHYSKENEACLGKLSRVVAVPDTEVHLVQI